jgi:predicted tellurium resistance membrane protein TerC
VGGALVASLLERLPWLIYLGAGILLIVAGELMAADPIVIRLVGESPWHQWIVAGALALVVGLALWLRRRRDRPDSPAAGAAPVESDILKV